jgi:N-acetylneuraminic acid mutarotase
MLTFRTDFASTSLNGRIYVLGGLGAEGVLGQMESYSPLTDRWTSRPCMPTPRFGLVAYALNGQVHAAGGKGNTRAFLNSFVEIFDPITNQWVGENDY